MLRFFRQRLCSHEVYIDDIKRQTFLTGEHYLVEAPCRKCGKVLTAYYGLALDAKLIANKPKGPVDAKSGSFSS